VDAAEKVRWKCSVFYDGKVWRWRALADGYVGMSGLAESEEHAMQTVRERCEAAVNARRALAGETDVIHFEIEV
jgi:hypothetical protein